MHLEVNWEKVTTLEEIKILISPTVKAIVVDEKELEKFQLTKLIEKGILTEK